jgi:hypothetical protein
LRSGCISPLILHHVPRALSSFSGQCWRWTTPKSPSYSKPFRAPAAVRTDPLSLPGPCVHSVKCTVSISCSHAFKADFLLLLTSWHLSRVMGVLFNNEECDYKG